MKSIYHGLDDPQFVSENLMGPNVLKLAQELTADMNLEKGMRVLDLGCGKGLSSAFLAQKFGVQVYATDLWISTSENFERFKYLGIADRVIPIHADVHALPYAESFFDAVISIDAYHYFGTQPEVLDRCIAPFIRSEGQIALSFPGFKSEDTHRCLPEAFFKSWKAEDLESFHSCEWWRQLLKGEKTVSIESVTEMRCADEAWNDWLASSNEYAIGDRDAMNAGAGAYMNFIAVKALKK